MVDTHSEDLLISEIRKLDTHLDKIYRSTSLPRAFLAGVLSGLGSVIGATIVVAALVYALSHLNQLPFLGNALSGAAQGLVQTISQPKK